MFHAILRRGAILCAAGVMVLGGWQSDLFAQSGTCTTGQSSSGTTTSGTTSSTSTTGQLSTATTALTQLLQSGTLTTAQQQRVASLLSALQNAQTGGTLSASQVRQLNSAVAAAHSIAARQSTGLTAGGVAGAGASSAVSRAFAANSTRQSASLSQRSLQFAGPRGR